MDIKKELAENGFVFIPKWKPDCSIKSLAASLGTIVKISSYFNHSMISDVQVIYPKDISFSSNNQYSGKFGLNAFPLHTDLAHWSTPPKYLMLRCVSGYEEVSTKVLPLNLVADLMFDQGLRRAVAKSRGKQSVLLPLLFTNEGENCIRWDSLFLEPVNENAKSIKNLMSDYNFWNMAIDLKLINFGDTLVINNHLNFHARSSVPLELIDRQIERIYFN
ncbi:hypothetical protein DT594_12415 [Halopseudomonas laoshanensis]|uniref:TauD/TfdA-like domain-containing protein n=1 Tax=Halopseudomonas laoshanensis TaxID=2268758 RepID=A0A7V7KWL2_9GAMM|nr:TauD/TfdA family dioxygenase [Halopseudomonas laoshanensis]KAA0694108.1 hypothetical protein DT594_12415 [Halopseudomonas laoshanensis]